MSGNRHPAFRFVLFFCFGGTLCRAADLQEIVERASAAIKTDWAADAEYACVERDETIKDGRTTSKTFEAITMEGSEYDLPLAVNDQPLPPDREKAEIEKLKAELHRRQSESPSARRERIDKYNKQRDENGALLLDFSGSFTFELLREETLEGRPAYVLAATAKKRTGPLTRAEKVLAGMRGTVWIDKESFHAIRVECDVITPVPIYGILAKVLPGTHIRIDMAAVTPSASLVTGFSLDLTLSKLMMFRSKEVTRMTYSQYRTNQAELEDLLNGRPAQQQ
jgi:hypothetical protein